MQREFDIEKIGLLVNDTARVWRTRLDRRLRPLGLSQGKWTTLVHLSRGADKLTQKEIAALIGIEEPTLAGLLNRLQSDGWIKRKASPHDRRCKTVHLQPQSKKVLSQIFGTAHVLRQELIAGIPHSDLQACMRVLTHIRQKAEHVTEQPFIRNGNGARNTLNGNGAKNVGSKIRGSVAKR